MIKNSECNIGIVELSLKGPSKLINLITSEFSKSNVPNKYKTIPIDVNFLPIKNKDKDYSITKDERGSFFDTGYSVNIDWENKSLTCYFDEHLLKKGLTPTIARVWDWSYMYPHEIFIKNIIYDILEPYAHILMISEGIGFIHSSAIKNKKKKEKSILFTGEGGVGKTALVMLGFRNNYNYMNDDLSLVDKDGFCYHYPKKLQVYGYNVSDDKYLKENLLANRTFLDKLMWSFRHIIKDPSNVRRRIEPIILFGKSISKNSKISTVFFLKTDESYDKIEINPIKEKYFITRELNIIQEEFSDFVKYIRNKKPEIYKLFIEETEELYKDIFEQTGCYELTIPKNPNFEEIFEYIKYKSR